MKDTVFYKKNTLNISGKLFALDQPLIMGVLNATPDSFYDGGRYLAEEAIINHAEKLVIDGADFIDIGGYSSRPGADFVSEEEEINRIKQCVGIVSKRFPKAIISIDTFRSAVAKVAVDQGATIINDISGGEADQLMFETVAALKVPYVLMHMRGNPKNMQTLTNYVQMDAEIINYFQKKIKILNKMGVQDIILDPGFGFSKTLDQNYELLRKLDYFNMLNLPILVGISRKSMIYKQLGITAEEALNGTSILHTIALMKGARILRVHDIKEAREVITLFQKTFK